MPDRWGQAKPLEHTFSNGRTAILRDLGAWALIRDGVFDQDMWDAFNKAGAGLLENAQEAQRLADTILERMFVEPVVTADRAKVDYEATPEIIHVSDVPDEIVNEVFELAFKGVAEAQRFRADGDSPTGGADGEGMGDDAEQAAGAAGGNGARVADRRAARKPARARAGAGS